MHKILRTFTAGRGQTRVGKIIDASGFRNLGFLVRKGYLEPVGDSVQPDPTEEAYIETAPHAAEDPVAADVEASQQTAKADALDAVADLPVSSLIEKPEGRVVIIGGPKTGKTTLAAAMGGGRSTDEVIDDLDWSEASEEIATWLNEPGPWLIEGVAVPRALRKWRESHPDEPAPVDHVIHLQRRYEELSPETDTMAKGVETVLDEILPWLLETADVVGIEHEGVKSNEPSITDASKAVPKSQPNKSSKGKAGKSKS